MTEEEFDLLAAGPWWLLDDWKLAVEIAQLDKQCKEVAKRIIQEEAAMTPQTARLPVELTRRTVGDLEVQEVGVTHASQLQVDSERGCWLSPATPIMQYAETRQVAMRVWREDDGYHVIVPSGCKFEVTEDLDTDGLLPLAEVAVETR